MDWRSRREPFPILMATSAVATAVVVVVLLIWFMGAKLGELYAEVFRSQRTQLLLSDIYAAISEAEAEEKGFILTWDQRYLNLYASVLTRLSAKLDRLKAAADEGAVDRQAANEIRDLIELRVEEIERAFETHRVSGRDAAISAIQVDAHALENIRRVIVQAKQAQEDRTERLLAASRRARSLRSMVVLGGAAIVLIFIGWAHKRLVRDIKERERARAELAESQQRLEGIVSSAMDAIISVDENQNIVLFNAAAERIFGYRAQEVMGKPLDILIPERFRAIHRQHVYHFGQTGETTRAMGKETNMDLFALRSDGTEFPIDASISQVVVEGKRLYTAILRDITSRKRFEQELVALHEELERRVEERTAELAAANRELEAFGYSVSHDLRAPLRHVAGFVELLEKHAGHTLDEKGKRYLKTIHEASGRMGNLIDDLLTLSRIGRSSINETDVSIRELLDECIAQLSDEASGRRIDWKIGELPVVRGDPTLLHNVVMNLVSNALKYTRTRDPAIIEVGSYKQEDEVICFFRDNGVGFDMQFVDKLFGVFQRLHRAEEFEGTGIGLASVRRIIQKHGGRTWAEGALNQGATFYFSLPITGQQQHDERQTNSPGRG